MRDEAGCEGTGVGLEGTDALEGLQNMGCGNIELAGSPLDGEACVYEDPVSLIWNLLDIQAQWDRTCLPGWVSTARHNHQDGYSHVRIKQLKLFFSKLPRKAEDVMKKCSRQPEAV